MMFAEEVVKEADQYNGFNLIVADICSKNMVYVTNRPKQDANFIRQVSPGIYALSNSNLDTPWPKVKEEPCILFLSCFLQVLTEIQLSCKSWFN